MITFRSFSRFVRWYRWPLLLTLGFALGLSPLPAATIGGVLAFVGIPALLLSWRWAYMMKDRVRERMNRIRSGRENVEQASLRAMPLRGWTK